MKIETLLRAYTRCLTDADHYRSDRSFNSFMIERRNKQSKTIRKGIVRKFERLEKMLNLERMVTKLASRSFDQAWDETFLDQHRKDLIYKGNE